MEKLKRQTNRLKFREIYHIINRNRNFILYYYLRRLDKYEVKGSILSTQFDKKLIIIYPRGCCRAAGRLLTTGTVRA